MITNDIIEPYILLEGMTSISAVINGIRSGVNDRRILRILIDRERMSAKTKEVGFLTGVAKELDYEIEATDSATIDQMTSGTTHGGIVALCSGRPLASLQEKLQDDSGIWTKQDGFFVMLEGIEDPYNFGYTIRSLYAAGVDGIILSPRNWMSAAGVVARSSAGASELLPMVESQPEPAAELLHARGYRVVCAGIRDSVSVYEADLKRPLFLVVGGEKRGISRALLNCADEVVRIDYGREFKGSLSTASAATLLAFEVLRQNLDTSC